ncbi:MAG: GTP-binding protein [Phycisphaerae bacterium]
MCAPREPNSFTVLTPPGPAAIAVVRLAGSAVAAFLAQHVRLRRARGAASRAEDWGDERVGSVRRAALLDADGAPLDDVLLSVHGVGPALDVRLHLHGSPPVVGRVAELARAAGFRIDGPEELVRSSEAPFRGAAPADSGGGVSFWPATDALEREAFALAPRMLTERGARWLLAQPARLRAAIDALRRCGASEDARATCAAIARRRCIVDWFTAPLRIAIVGPPNAGKSTLTNAMAQQSVSLVSPTPGTTRDWIEAPGELDGFPALWIDTAGLRHTHDELEAAGIARTRRVLAGCDASVVLLDGGAAAEGTRREFCAHYRDLAPSIVVLNKADSADAGELARAAETVPTGWRELVIAISAARGEGLDRLTDRLVAAKRSAARVLTSTGRMDDAPAAYTDRHVRYFMGMANATDDGCIQTSIDSLLLD